MTTPKCDPCDGGSIDCAYCEHKLTGAELRTCLNCLWSDNTLKCSDVCIQCGPGLPTWKPRAAESPLPVLFPVPVVTDTALAALDKQVGGSHYKGFKIQPIEFAAVNGLSFIEGNVVKYVVRRKGDKAKRLEDLRKAIDCLEKLSDFVERDLCS